VSDLIRLPNGDAYAGETVISVKARKRTGSDTWFVVVRQEDTFFDWDAPSDTEAIAERDRIIGLVDVARREAALDPVHFKTNAGPVWVMGENAWTGQLVTLNQASGTLRVYNKAEGSILPESSDPEAYAEMMARENLARNWLRLEMKWWESEFSEQNKVSLLDELNIAMLDLKEVFRADPTPIRVSLWEVYPNEKGVPKYRVVEGGGE
jgi:hypothetical protein